MKEEYLFKKLMIPSGGKKMCMGKQKKGIHNVVGI